MTGIAFKDHFSGHARAYARHRPTYPAALYDWLASLAPDQESAWDAATGNGQAAVELSKRFKQVIATDGSAEQIAQATQAPNVEYRVETAEANSIADHSQSLVTVAQAYHWFDHEKFVQQVQRVKRPGGVLAIWTYGLAEINPVVDQRVRKFYSGPIDAFWPAERRLVEEGYRGLEFPWPEIEVPQFTLQRDWSLDDLLGYLRTWSAVQRYQAEKQQDPVSEWQAEFVAAWGGKETLQVSWPLRVRCFRISG